MNITINASIYGKYPSANDGYVIKGTITGNVNGELKSNGNISGKATINVAASVSGVSVGYTIKGNINGNANGSVSGKLKKEGGEVKGIDSLNIELKPSISITASIKGAPAGG